MNPMSIPREELFDRLRRQFARYKFRVDAELMWRSRRVWGRVIDISRGGMFIEVENPPRPGASFAVYLALNTPLQLDCKVRRVVPGRGIGVTLTVPSDMRGRFDALLTALASGADPSAAAVNLPVDAPQRVMAKAAGSLAR